MSCSQCPSSPTVNTPFIHLPHTSSTITVHYFAYEWNKKVHYAGLLHEINKRLLHTAASVKKQNQQTSKQAKKQNKTNHRHARINCNTNRLQLFRYPFDSVDFSPFPVFNLPKPLSWLILIGFHVCLCVCVCVCVCVSVWVCVMQPLNEKLFDLLNIWKRQTLLKAPLKLSTKITDWLRQQNQVHTLYACKPLNL